MVDRGYRGVVLTRTIAYDRVEDVMVVWDRLQADKVVRASQQWGLGRDRAVSLDGDAVHTSGPGANLSMLFTSGGAPQDLAVGKKSPMRGWNSESYGELSPAPSVRATQKGSSLSWLTVLAPRADGVPASSVTASASVSSAAASVAAHARRRARPRSTSTTSAARAPPRPRSTPTAVPAAPVVLAGTRQPGARRSASRRRRR